MKTTEIGLFEAKTKLSELMRRVAEGERFIITVRGKPMAELNPLEAISEERRARAHEAAEWIRNFRPANAEPKFDQAEIRRMREFGRR